MRPLQPVLLLAAAAWGIWPRWGSILFGIIYGLFLLGVAGRWWAATGFVDNLRPVVETTLTLEHGRWLARHAFFYCQPFVSWSYSATAHFTGLLTIPLGLTLAVRGTWDHTLWWHLPAVVAVYVIAGLLGARLNQQHIVEEGEKRAPLDWIHKRRLHGELAAFLRERGMIGELPPVIGPHGKRAESQGGAASSPWASNSLRQDQAIVATVEWVRNFRLSEVARQIACGTPPHEVVQEVRRRNLPHTLIELARALNPQVACCVYVAGQVVLGTAQPATLERFLMERGIASERAKSMVRAAVAAKQ